MPERVITLAISDADWKALRAVQPEPVDWLKRTIRDAIDAERRRARAPGRQGRRRAPRASLARSVATRRPTNPVITRTLRPRRPV
jgi:hypothetical protein